MAPSLIAIRARRLSRRRSSLSSRSIFCRPAFSDLMLVVSVCLLIDPNTSAAEAGLRFFLFNAGLNKRPAPSNSGLFSVPNKTKAATLRVAACGNFMMCSLFFLSLHTTRLAAPHKEVAVTKGEAKSAGVHAGQIVVWVLPDVKDELPNKSL